jgi:hypothetical protein
MSDRNIVGGQAVARGQLVDIGRFRVANDLVVAMVSMITRKIWSKEGTDG